MPAERRSSWHLPYSTISVAYMPPVILTWVVIVKLVKNLWKIRPSVTSLSTIIQELRSTGREAHRTDYDYWRVSYLRGCSHQILIPLSAPVLGYGLPAMPTDATFFYR
jgi:hypothetical protein